MKILITGVYGIIGSYLCEKLRNEGFFIVGIGKKESYNGCNKYYYCDIINMESMEKVFKENSDIEVVIHCAALAHNKGDDLSRERFIKINYDGTKNLVDMCNKFLKLKSFIFLSTISVYGERFSISEYREYETISPKTPYAVSKKLSESYIRENLKGDYSILRLASVYSKDFDRNGCFSGSAIEIDGQLYLYYTAIKYAKENPSNVHNQYSDDDLRASQALVVSSDGIHFDNVKNKKQIIPMIQEAYIGDYRHTRDPKVWKKQDGKYAMVIGSKVAYENDYCGKALFYESEDGIHFEYKNSYQEPTIGNMWECPDVFKINDQFFMIFSPENTDQPPKPNSNARYMPIDFDEDTLTIKDHGDWPYLDHGLDFYAPQTFLSKDNERLLLGWLRMRKPVQGEEWIGMFIMPRILHEKDGKIIQELYPEIKNSFNHEVQEISFDQPFQLKTTFNKDSSLNLGGFKIDIQDDCLHLNREEVSIQENKVCNDVVSPKLQGHYDIELYYDHHVFEIYINGGEYVMSQVVYDLNDQVIIQNTEYKVYVRSL